MADPTHHSGVGAASSGGATTIDAPAMSTTTGRYLFVVLSKYQAGTTVSGVTDTAGNTYTRAGSSQGDDSSRSQETWFTASPITGNASNVVTATFSGSSAFRLIMVAEFSLSGSTAVAYSSEATVTVTGNLTTHTSNSVTTTAADALVIGGVQTYDSLQNISESVGSFAYVQNPGATADNMAMVYRNTDAAGGYTFEITSGANTKYLLTAKAFNFTVSAFKPAWARRSSQLIGGG